MSRPAPGPIERVGRLTPEEFARGFLGPGRPVVMTEALRGWGALARWSPEYFEGLFGPRSVKVASSAEGTFNYDPGASATYDSEEMPFSEAAALICGRRPSPRRYYLMQQSIPALFPELLPDFNVPEHIGPAKVQTNLWFGAAQNVTPLHFDMANNLFAQVYGRKRLLLFEPDQTARLYPFPVTARHAHISHVDPDRPDLERFPEYGQAAPLECVLEPGELLFLPAFWWHHVRSLEVGISVSFWWGARLEQFLVPAGRRLIPVLYDRDRLLSIGNQMLDVPAFGGFLGMARFLQSRGEEPLAVLFAGAALEEAVRQFYQRSVTRPETAALRDLARMKAALEEAGACTPGEGDDLEAWAALVSRAKQVEGSGLSPQEAASMLDGVEGFLSRHHAPARRAR